MADFDFTKFPLDEFVSRYAPEPGDALELFWLTRRIQLLGIRVEIPSPSPVTIQPFTNSGLLYPEIDCSEPSDLTYVPGGLLGKNTDVNKTALVIDDPDYLAVRIIDGSIDFLQMRVQLIVSDTFAWNAPTNSVKKDGR